MTDKWKLVPIEPTVEMVNEGECGCMDNDVTISIYRMMLNAAPTPPNQEAEIAELKAGEIAEKLWIWKNGDHYLAYRHEYPCFSQGGDPLTVGEPIGYALLKPSFGRESIAPTPPNTITIQVDEYERLKKDAERYRWLTEDHANREVRNHCREILGRMGAMSYSAASTAIDKARSEP